MNNNPLPFNPEDFPEDCYGFLVVQVSTARGAIPLEGALVDVLTYEPLDPPPERVADGILIATLTTDSDGNTPKLRLPSPPCSNANSPESVRPYALYQCIVRLPGYYEQTHVGIPVYEGITVIQPVVLIPLPENGSEVPPPESQYFETEKDQITEEGE
ncbi:MAG: hypothetical protein E7680_02215 [Ruminococcaceae bacterium]|nr:hypothetical protein [Oscillospiraceae bacterium]